MSPTVSLRVRNRQVSGSSPLVGSIIYPAFHAGERVFFLFLAGLGWSAFGPQNEFRSPHSVPQLARSDSSILTRTSPKAKNGFGVSMEDALTSGNGKGYAEYLKTTERLGIAPMPFPMWETMR